jgi:dipeptide/tripeptide permease
LNFPVLIDAATRNEVAAAQPYLKDPEVVAAAEKLPVYLENEADSQNSLAEVHYDDQGQAASVPTEEERKTLRRVAGSIPAVAYWICLVEFAERASYYGVKPLFGNFVNKGMPEGGNGFGAPAQGTQTTAGALGMGTVKSSAVSQSFSMLVYAFPIFFGWLADSRTGRWSLICWGVAVCGIAHVLMVGAGAPALLNSGRAAAPFFISVYVLAIGAGMRTSDTLTRFLS